MQLSGKVLNTLSSAEITLIFPLIFTDYLYVTVMTRWVVLSAVEAQRVKLSPYPKQLKFLKMGLEM